MGSEGNLHFFAHYPLLLNRFSPLAYPTRGIAIPKSVRKQRMEENDNSLDFDLSVGEMAGEHELNI